MKPGVFVLVSGIQLGMFLAPLNLAWAGVISGEVASLVAIVGWFVVSMPLSYTVADSLRRRKALRIARERSRLSSVFAGRAIVSSS